MKILLAALASLSVSLPRTAQQPQPPATDPGPEYEALSRAFDEAQDAYYAPLRNAKSDEERSKIQIDPNLDPRKLFLGRFQELAKRAKGADAGALSLLWLADNGAGVDPKAAAAAVDQLAADYVASPRMTDLCQLLRYGSDVVGTKRALEILDRIDKNSPLADARGAAVYVSGVLLLGEGGDRAEEARAKLRRVGEEFADTPWPARASAALFEAEHLQIGMVAPDFEATDQDGASYRLSGLRGKVVILDFWGFW